MVPLDAEGGGVVTTGVSLKPQVFAAVPIPPDLAAGTC